MDLKSTLFDTPDESKAQKCLPITCKHCKLSDFCHPQEVSASHAVETMKPLKKGKMLYKQHEPFRALYIIRTGSVKTFYIDEAGEEQVSGFYWPGQIIGLDGFHLHQYTNHAKAIDTVSACKLSLDQIHSERNDHLVFKLFEVMSEEIQRRQINQVLLGKKSVEEKMAVFLSDMVHHFETHQLESEHLILPMSRQDIGSFLGLAVETVSRMFTKLEHDGLIEISGKTLRIRSIEGLDQLRNNSLLR